MGNLKLYLTNIRKLNNRIIKFQLTLIISRSKSGVNSENKTFHFLIGRRKLMVVPTNIGVFL